MHKPIKRRTGLCYGTGCGRLTRHKEQHDKLGEVFACKFCRKESKYVRSRN